MFSVLTLLPSSCDVSVPCIAGVPLPSFASPSSQSLLLFHAPAFSPSVSLCPVPFGDPLSGFSSGSSSLLVSYLPLLLRRLTLK